jgi:hypothetical protein
MARTTRSRPAERPAGLESHEELLITVLQTIADRLQVVSDILDDIYSEFQWVVRNRQPCCPSSPAPLTSMSADPLDPEFGEKLNRMPPEQDSRPAPSDTPAKQQELWGE